MAKLGMTPGRVGGVVTELRDGGFEHQGKIYDKEEDIPGEGGYLFVPERFESLEQMHEILGSAEQISRDLARYQEKCQREYEESKK